MITAVLDANVLLAIASVGDLSNGVIANLGRAWNERHFRHLSSIPIYDETVRHLQDTYYRARVSDAQRDTLLGKLKGEIVQVSSFPRGIASHPEDDRVLAVAFVTGARRLFRYGRQTAVAARRNLRIEYR